MDPISKPAESFFVYDGDIVRLGEVQDLVCDIRVGLGGGGRGFEVFLLESLLGLAVAFLLEVGEHSFLDLLFVHGENSCAELGLWLWRCTGVHADRKSVV